MFFFLGTLWFLTLFATGQAKTSGVKDKILEKLFKVSGLNTRYQEVESFTDWYKKIDPESLQPSQVGLAKNLMRYQKGPSLVRKNLKKTFLAGFDPVHAEASIAWFKSKPGQKILKAKIEGNTSEKQKEREKFIKQSLNAPQNEARLLVIEKIISAEALTRNIESLFLAYVQSMFPFNNRLKGKGLVKVVKLSKREKSEFIRKKVKLQRLFDFKDLKEKDLKNYARFLNSPAGRWFTFLELKGFKKGSKKTLTKVREIQKKLLIEIEKGGPEFPLLQELAPAGKRYLLVQPRDPFKPLLKDKGPVQTKKPEVVAQARKFGAELEDIPRISIYIINKIERKRPKLFRKLKYYERLFNNQENLKAMNDEEYADSVKAYRTVLTDVHEIKVSKTPLQAEYEKLRLTGTISKNKNTLALVETSSQKGYVVNQGDLIGPKFGFVDTIQPDKIIVIEKFRNYLGKVLTKKRILEFAQNI